MTQLESFIAGQRRRRRFPPGFTAGVLARGANQGSIGDSWPKALLGCARGHSVALKLLLSSPEASLTLSWILSLVGRPSTEGQPNPCPGRERRPRPSESSSRRGEAFSSGAKPLEISDD